MMISTRKDPSVESTIYRIREQIRQTVAKIELSKTLPPNQPWISLQRVSDIKDLGGKYLTLREALEADLVMLKQKLRAARLAKQAEARKRDHATSRSQSKNFRDTARSNLLEAQKRGFLNQDDERAISEAAVRAITAGTNLVKNYPTKDNMKALIIDIQGALSTVDSDQVNSCIENAWNVCSEAGKKMMQDQITTFRRNPTVENLKEYASDAELAMMFSSDIEFSSKPPARKKTGSHHEVTRGDTLSKISLEYYGHPGYWDVIFFANFEVIGNNPEDLRAGTKLSIP